jgi:hypothetical protein
MATASPNSLLAGIIWAFSGKPAITINHSASSPSGTLTNDKEQVLAVFDVRASNVRWQATLRSLSISVPLSGVQASYLAVNNFKLSYRYCTNPGTYGYGYKGGACGTIGSLSPSLVTRSGDTYTIVFQKDLPVYLAQSSGTLTLSGTPLYVKPGMKAVQLRAAVTAGTGIGDQCKTIWYGVKKRYGYSKCGNEDAIVNVAGARGGNLLTVARPAGYGYPTTPLPKPTTSLPRPTPTPQQPILPRFTVPLR